MKHGWLYFAFALLLTAFTAQGVTAQTTAPHKGSNLSGPPSNGIPTPILHEVLTQAAPQFGVSVDRFIRLYYSCGCISVVQVGTLTYRVTYGGVGIQILIDATRAHGFDPKPRPTSLR